jgi:hypothetical protein
VLLIGGLGAPPTLATSKALDLNGVTTGPLLRLADLLGLNNIAISGVPIVGDINVSLNSTGQNSVNLYNKINAFPFGGFTLGSFFRQPGGTLGTALLAASGIAVGNAVKAYEALLASAGGNTPNGYTPLTPAGMVNSLTGQSCTSGLLCVQGTNVTNLALAFINDPGTPNGGLYTRFGSILNLFGINPITPGGQSASGTGVRVNGATVNVGWGYSLMSDFPATINPVSLLNSVLATLLPTNLLGGFTLGGASMSDIETNLALLASLGTTSTSYSTLVPNDLPLLEPLRLPSRIINAALGALGIKARVGTPLANALQPALSILTNIGYTDVVLPSDGGTYNRSYDQSGTYTQFMSKAILTPKQWLQIPGDVIRALIVGFQDQFPILRFGRPAPTLVADGDHLTISYGTTSTTPVATVATVTTAVTTTTPTSTPGGDKAAAKAAAKVARKAARSVAAQSVSVTSAAGSSTSVAADTGTRTHPAKRRKGSTETADSTGATSATTDVGGSTDSKTKTKRLGHGKRSRTHHASGSGN